MAMTNITIKDKDFVRALKAISKGIANDKKWRAKHIRVYRKKLYARVRERFDKTVDEKGRLWPPLAATTVRIRRCIVKHGGFRRRDGTWQSVHPNTYRGRTSPRKGLLTSKSKILKAGIKVKVRDKGNSIWIVSKFGGAHFRGSDGMPVRKFIGFSEGDINLLIEEIIKWWKRAWEKKGIAG